MTIDLNIDLQATRQTKIWKNALLGCFKKETKQIENLGSRKCELIITPVSNPPKISNMHLSKSVALQLKEDTNTGVRYSLPCAVLVAVSGNVGEANYFISFG